LTYLLILFVIAVALAPLAHFAPSKAQRETARMREYAAVHGLFVEFRDVPGTGDARDRQHDRAGGNTIYYGKRLPASRDKREEARAWRRENEHWIPLQRRWGVPDVLVSLPLEVIAASVDRGSCGVYWRECGGVDNVALIEQVLTAWSTELRG